MQTDRIDKGMIVLTPQPTAALHARLMAQVFPELPEAAAVEMGGEVRKTVPLSLYPDEYVSPDQAYDNFKYFLRRNSF